MTTKDIKADYGAKGDGQKVTATISISSGTKNLSSTTNLWSSGDVGKSIAVGGAGTAGGFLGSTIATFTDSQHIVISNNAITTVTSASKTLEWGTDDSSAFSTFNTAFQGQSGIILTIPTGRYIFGGGLVRGIDITAGITSLTLSGAGTPILSDLQGQGRGYFLGGALAGSGQFNDNLHDARIASVSKGATALILANGVQNSSLTNPFVINSWCILTGLDVQGFGTPSNQYLYERVFITSISGGTLNLQNPITNSYESNWPVWNSGNSGTVDCGGPATLYQIPSGWVCTHTYSGIMWECQGGQINSAGQTITFDGGGCLGFGIYPSVSDNWTVQNFDASGMADMEVDKLVNVVTISNSTFHGIIFQSPSPNNMNLTNVTILNTWNGSGKNITATGCSFPSSTNFGTTSYGCTTSVNCNTCTFSSLIIGGVSESDVFGAGAYTLNQGVISRKLSSGSGEPPQWANPGNWVWLQSSSNSEEYAFKIAGIINDGALIYISTNMSSLPLIPNNGTYSIKTHTCPQLTFTSCTGCDEALSFSNSPPNKPLGSYWNLNYSGNIGTVRTPLIISGKLISAAFNVTTPLVGLSGKFDLNSPFVYTISDGTERTWSPSIDLTAAGLRTITTSGVTGSTGTDSGLTLPGSGDVWILPNQITPQCTTNLSGASQLPVINLTLTLDQGISFVSGGRNVKGRF